MKSLSFMVVLNPISFLERSDWKSFSITSSVLLLIVTFMLSFFECITRSSSLSLEDIKLIAIVNWFFHVSYFLRSFMIFFRYGLNLLTCSTTNSVFFLSPLLSCSRITYSYWFVMLFFFMLRKVLIVSFSFFSLKRFLIASILVSST